MNLLLQADSKDAETKIGSLVAGLQRLERQTSGMRGAFGAIVGGASPIDQIRGQAENLVGAIPMIGPALQSAIPAVEGFFGRIRDTQKAILDQGHAALAAGANIGQYSGLLYAAGDAADSLQGLLFHLSSGIGEALGGGEKADAIKRLGLDMKDLAGQSTDEQFMRVVGALHQIQNASERNSEAMRLFGKEAKGVMGMIEKGPDWIKNKIEIGKAKGKVFSEEEFASMEQANKAMKQLETSTDSLWKTLAMKLSPTVQSLGNDWADQGKRVNQDLANQGSTLLTLKYMFQDLGDAFSGNFSGPSAQTRAMAELAQQAQARKNLIDQEKEKSKQLREQLDIEQKLTALEKGREQTAKLLESDDPFRSYKEAMKNYGETHDARKSHDEQVKLYDDIVKHFAKPFSDMGKGDIDKAFGELDKLQKAKDLFKENFTDADYQASVGKVTEQIQKLVQAQNELRSPDALGFGSDSEYQARLSNEQRAANPLNDIRELLKRAQEQQRAQNDKLMDLGRKMLEAMNKKPPVAGMH